jgi:hypothetical protein
LPLDALGGTPAAEVNAGVRQCPGNGAAVHTTLQREGENGLPLLVLADKLVEVWRVPFSGHVYNLQTATGWYIAGYIITHNCRCGIIYEAERPAEGDEVIAPERD